MAQKLMQEYVHCVSSCYADEWMCFSDILCGWLTIPEYNLFSKRVFGGKIVYDVTKFHKLISVLSVFYLKSALHCKSLANVQRIWQKKRYKNQSSWTRNNVFILGNFLFAASITYNATGLHYLQILPCSSKSMGGGSTASFTWSI